MKSKIIGALALSCFAAFWTSCIKDGLPIDLPFNSSFVMNVPVSNSAQIITVEKSIPTTFFSDFLTTSSVKTEQISSIALKSVQLSMDTTAAMTFGDVDSVALTVNGTNWGSKVVAAGNTSKSVDLVLPAGVELKKTFTESTTFGYKLVLKTRKATPTVNITANYKTIITYKVL